MIARKFPLFRRLHPVLALVAGVCVGASPVFAQAPEPSPSIEAPSATWQRPAPRADGDRIRLTDEERDAILDSQSADGRGIGLGDPNGPGLFGRGIHGEVGMMIGTHGTRGAYGAADIPLGENAGASVSFESSRFGGYRRRPR